MLPDYSLIDESPRDLNCQVFAVLRGIGRLPEVSVDSLGGPMYMSRTNERNTAAAAELRNHLAFFVERGPDGLSNDLWNQIRGFLDPNEFGVSSTDLITRHTYAARIRPKSGPENYMLTDQDLRILAVMLRRPIINYNNSGHQGAIIYFPDGDREHVENLIQLQTHIATLPLDQPPIQIMNDVIGRHVYSLVRTDQIIIAAAPGGAAAAPVASFGAAASATAAPSFSSASSSYRAAMAPGGATAANIYTIVPGSSADGRGGGAFSGPRGEPFIILRNNERIGYAMTNGHSQAAIDRAYKVTSGLIHMDGGKRRRTCRHKLNKKLLTDVLGRVLSRKLRRSHLHRSHRKSAAKARRSTQRRKSNK
jgi:hypothetical protein